MSNKKITEAEKDQEFKKFQGAFQNVLGKFLVEGYDMLYRHKVHTKFQPKAGSVEALLFTLLWSNVLYTYSEEEDSDTLEHIHQLFSKILNGDGPEPMEELSGIEKIPSKHKLN
jgi:ABC-type cobalt transport system substrate-binding protein|tara:strand:+ start:464 stop:805 length:342 start_codon:yes stop_codon:yes gene_type:complete